MEKQNTGNIFLRLRAMLYKRLLVTGADGMLGWELSSYFRQYYDVYPFSKKDLNITDRTKIKKLFSAVAPDLIINCAAFTNVEACEKNTELAYEINAKGAFYLADESEKNNAAIVHISTDYVYNGHRRQPYSEDDACAPLNIYGKSKLEGEQLVARTNDRHYIIRTAWLYGKTGDNFITKILGQAAVKSEIRVVQDQIGNPTSVPELIKMIGMIIAEKQYGIYHASSSDEASWYELAKEVMKIKNCNAAVHPIQSDRLNSPVKRPKYTVLSKKKLADFCGFQPAPWDKALSQFLHKEII